MRTLRFVLAAIAVIASAGAARAEDDLAQQLQELREQVRAQSQQIQSQQNQIAQLRSDRDQSWLNAERAEQVKALVREVLADADTRASLMDSSVTAGHDGKRFFLASEDGAFLMTFDGQLQIRYIWSHTRSGEPAHNNLEGFALRRAKLGVYGHIYDPKLTYGLRLISEGDQAAFVNYIDVEDAWVAYDFTEGWNVKLGQFKAPFLREEAVDSRYQLAVERSRVADLFTVDYTEGAQVSYSAAQWRAMVMLHNGSYAGSISGLDGATYASDNADFAVAARAEYMLMGTWDQFNDYVAWNGDQHGLLIGAGVDYENGEGETTATTADVTKWTADVTYESPDASGISAFAAVVGNHIRPRESNQRSADQLGVVIQVGTFVVPGKFDLFGRYEYLDLGQARPNGTALLAGDDNNISILTFGGNYYLHRHDAKFTLDLVWALDSLSALGADYGAGLVPASGGDQLALRAQFQLLF